MLAHCEEYLDSVGAVTSTRQPPCSANAYALTQENIATDSRIHERVERATENRA
jgi:hypothetical protein